MAEAEPHHARVSEFPGVNSELALRVPRKLLMVTNPVNLEGSKDSKRKRAPAVDERASALRCGVCGPRLGPFL